MAFKKVLVPLDGSPLAESVLPLVRKISGMTDVIVLLRVVEPEPMPVFDQAQRTLARELVERQEDAEKYLAPIAEDLRTRGVRVDTIVSRGEAAKEILRVTREIDADLVVMCTHGRTGIPRLVVGSVAEAIVRRSGVPVLLSKSHDVRNPVRRGDE